MKICIAILTRPQNEQNEYTFDFISMYSYKALLKTTTKRTKRIEFVLMYMKICIAILTRPQNDQNEYTFTFISM